MSAVEINWRVRHGPCSDVFWVADTVLRAALFGEASRYCIEEYRTHVGRFGRGVAYRVRDALNCDTDGYSKAVLHTSSFRVIERFIRKNVNEAGK